MYQGNLLADNCKLLSGIINFHNVFRRNKDILLLVKIMRDIFSDSIYI